MAVGYYVTVVREPRKVGLLLGPYPDEPAARKRLPVARRLALNVDPFAAFDLFGTARLERDVLPEGKLNARLETSI